MKKDAYYFPHFCNARHDRKLKRIQKDLGLEGYGIFFMLLEVLREQTDFKYPYTDIDLLADEFGTSAAKVEVVVNNYDLFNVDEDNNFFSPKLVFYLQPYLEKSERARIAANKRWSNVNPINANAYANALPEQSKCNANEKPEQCASNASKVKKSKVKESKVKNIYADVVRLSDDEYQNLITLFGEQGAKKRIEDLSLYLQSKGDKYKSHYATILNWERKNGEAKGNGFNTYNNFDQRQYTEDELEEYYEKI